MRNLVQRLTFAFASCGIYMAFSVLFGAPLFSKMEETFCFASLLTLITVVPFLLKYTPCPRTLNYVFVDGGDRNSLYDFLVRWCGLLGLAGAWMGAVFIPLDWDRWWQEWPISCCVGALVGCSLGLTAAAIRQLRLLAKSLGRRRRQKLP